MLLLACLLALSSAAAAKVQYKVQCTESLMTVELPLADDITEVYLQNLKHYTDPQCRPTIAGNVATFKLQLTDIYSCGVTKVSNVATGLQVYYHSVVVESGASKEVVTPKCVVAPASNATHALVKRNVWPAGFEEPEVLEITGQVVGKAPMPKLNVSVRQGGQLVTGELNVNPGTPLQMEIFLDENSAPVFGLLVSYMQVSDTKNQEETIIFNGCSVDPYLFENFNTVDGDFLSAKFRAFKFPDSTYVLFKGTVNVCLDKCRGVDCANGQKGFGRRKRTVSEIPPDPNKVFEIRLSTMIKVNYNETSKIDKENEGASNKTTSKH